jgi:predicted DNA-binding antitoxin AbrB/MazE fold protein
MEGIPMARTIRARVTRGNLAPLEPLDLPDGSEVDVTVATVPSADDVAASRAAAGGWKGKIDAEALIRDIYADRLLQTRRAPHL